MAGFLTNHTNNRVLDCLFGGKALEASSMLYVGLSLTRAFKGGFITEPSGGGYARVPLSNTLSLFPPAALGGKANALPVVFPEPTDGWGTVASVFVADAPTEGNVLAMVDLPNPRCVLPGDPGPRIAAAALSFCYL